MSILRIDSSARKTGSVTRDLLDQIETRLGRASAHLDLANTPLPQITETWLGANFTAEAERSEAQRAALVQSDALVAQLQEHDTILIGAPIYNFALPAALKAWIDLVARAGVTFRYTENGPVGLLTGKRAIVAIASGGTQVGSDYDFASGYIRHVLGFIGITDVEFVTADRMMVDADSSRSQAARQINALAA
jgi:FMN-dependent NADH-azoreductase